MEYKVVERTAPGREKVEVLGETYEEGKPIVMTSAGGGKS